MIEYILKKYKVNSNNKIQLRNVLENKGGPQNCSTEVVDLGHHVPLSPSLGVLLLEGAEGVPGLLDTDLLLLLLLNEAIENVPSLRKIKNVIFILIFL